MPKRTYFKSAGSHKRKSKSQTVKQKLERREAKQKFLQSDAGKVELEKLAAVESMSFRFAAESLKRKD
jgi:hypothetical protein